MRHDIRVYWIIVLLLFTPGCAATRRVHLDTGEDRPITYTPIHIDPIEVQEREFKAAVTSLVLDMDMDVATRVAEQDDPLTLLASTGGLVDGVQGRTASPFKSGLGLSLLQGDVEAGPGQRRMLALHFALDTVWEGVEDVVKDLANPAGLRAMIGSVIGTALMMLVAPEPLTKLIAIALTASLIAYLGTGPVWNIGQGFLRLIHESSDAKDTSALKDVGHRFGRVLGDNGARILVVAALAALGGKTAMAARGPKIPRFEQAASRARLEGGFELSAALANEVHAISLPSAGVLNIALAPSAVAAVALGPGRGGGTAAEDAIPGDPDGEVHHICTNKNAISDKTGGPWTPVFENLFKRAQLSMEHVANKVRIKGHQGPHPREYHELILKRLTDRMRGCRGAEQCRAALLEELNSIARSISTPGSSLRNLLLNGGD